MAIREALGSLFGGFGTVCESATGATVAVFQAIEVYARVAKESAEVIEDNVKHFSKVCKLENEADLKVLEATLNAKTQQAIAKQLFKNFKTYKDLETRLIELGATAKEKARILDLFDYYDEDGEDNE